MNELRSRTSDNRQPAVHAVSDHSAYWLAAGVAGLFISLTSSPFSPAHSLVSHLSLVTLTLIYATYGLGVLAALLLARPGARTQPPA